MKGLNSISKDLLAQKLYWEPTKHCYRGRSWNKGKISSTKLKPFTYYTKSHQDSLLKVAQCIKSPQPSATNKPNMLYTVLTLRVFKNTHCLTFLIKSKWIEIGLKKKKLPSPPTKIQQHGELSELKLVLSISLRHERRLPASWWDFFCFQRYHTFPSSFRCKHSSTSLYHLSAALYCFSRKIKRKPRSWLLHLSYQLHWLEWRLAPQK